jgi:hypothetical protein
MVTLSIRCRLTSAPRHAQIGAADCGSIQFFTSTQVTCVLPPGAGFAQPVIAYVALLFSQSVNLVSYAAPTLTAISGTGTTPARAGLVEAGREFGCVRAGRHVPAERAEPGAGGGLCTRWRRRCDHHRHQLRQQVPRRCGCGGSAADARARTHARTAAPSSSLAAARARTSRTTRPRPMRRCAARPPRREPGVAHAPARAAHVHAARGHRHPSGRVPCAAGRQWRHHHAGGLVPALRAWHIHQPRPHPVGLLVLPGA